MIELKCCPFSKGIESITVVNENSTNMYGQKELLLLMQIPCKKVIFKHNICNNYKHCQLDCCKVKVKGCLYMNYLDNVQISELN